ncbi:MAG: DnaD domain protein [Eubacteriales bacterium]|nr:DnaD domain protein [Eubacteriales bacterium]
MMFKLQQEKIDFGNTSIENIFINDFMPVAKGDFVKVYLLGFKYAMDGESNFSNETISKNMGLSLEEVNEAWKYWKDQGIVNINTNTQGNLEIEFVNLKQFYVENIYRYLPKDSTLHNDRHEQKTDFDMLIEANKSQPIKDMFREVELTLGRLVTPNEKRNILDWIANYSATPEIIVETFKYSVEKKSIKSMKYVETLLAAWFDNNIHDKEELSKYLDDKKRNFKYYNTVKKHLGFDGRQLTLSEKKIIDVWVDQWGFSMEMIIHALSFSSKTTNPNLNYFNTILENWYKSDFKKIEDVARQQKPQPKYNKNNPKTLHNFEQQYNKLSEEELEDMARKNYFDLIKDEEDI